MRFRERSPKNCEVLGKNINQSSVDLSITGYNAVAEVILLIKPEIFAAVHDKFSQFLEAALVHQEMYSFPRRQLSLAVLLLYSFFTTAKQGFLIFAFVFVEFLPKEWIRYISF